MKETKVLTDEQKTFYQENGYILLDNVFTPEEIEECSQAYTDIFAAKSKNSSLESVWDGDWKDSIKQKEAFTVLSIHNLQCHNAVFTKMLLNERLVNSVSELIGSPNVLLHHTKAHIKPPGKGAQFPTHQDYLFFPFKKDSMVAVFIHLDDSDPENGGLCIFPGSHKLGPLKNMSNVDTHFWVDQEKFALEKATPVVARKGDIVIFSYLLVHGSYPNISDRIRRMLLFQMVSAEDEPVQNVHRSPCSGMVLKGENQNKNADFENRFQH